MKVVEDTMYIPDNLEEYIEGSGCTCYAWCANECCCQDADWTDKEVYELRQQVVDLKEELQDIYLTH